MPLTAPATDVSPELSPSSAAVESLAPAISIDELVEIVRPRDDDDAPLPPAQIDTEYADMEKDLRNLLKSHKHKMMIFFGLSDRP